MQLFWNINLLLNQFKKIKITESLRFSTENKTDKNERFIEIIKILKVYFVAIID